MNKGKKTHMQKTRECIYRLRLKHSPRQISKDLHIHRSILRNIRDVANQRGWLDSAFSIPDDYQIHQVFNEQQKSHTSIFEPYFELIKEWWALN